MKYFIFSFIALIFSACTKETHLGEAPKPSGEGILKVTVTQPKYGPGPGMLVHIYFTEDDFNNRKPYESKITDNNGVVLFQKYYSGAYYVDCTVNKDSGLYASAPAYIPSVDTSFVNLDLQ